MVIITVSWYHTRKQTSVDEVFFPERQREINTFLFFSLLSVDAWTASFWRGVARLFVRYADDQRSLNRALSDAKLKFTASPESVKQNRDEWACGKTANGLRVCLLPHRLVRRQCMATSREYNLQHSTVLHCHGSKHGGLKEEMLNKRGVWMLPLSGGRTEKAYKRTNEKDAGRSELTTNEVRQSHLDEWLRSQVV